MSILHSINETIEITSKHSLGVVALVPGAMPNVQHQVLNKCLLKRVEEICIVLGDARIYEGSVVLGAIELLKYER